MEGEPSATGSAFHAVSPPLISNLLSNDQNDHLRTRDWTASDWLNARVSYGFLVLRARSSTGTSLAPKHPTSG
jgi:hypothetical protein